MSYKPKRLAAKDPTGDVPLPTQRLPQSAQFALFFPTVSPQ